MSHTAGPLNMPPAEPDTTITIQTHTTMRDVVYFNTLGMPSPLFAGLYFILIIVLVYSMTGTWSILSSLAWLVVLFATTTSLCCAYSYFKKGILGAQTITITPEFIRETSPHSERRYDWSKVSWVFKNKKYVSILVAPNMVIAIDRKNFHSQQKFDETSALIHTYWKAGQNKVNLLK